MTRRVLVTGAAGFTGRYMCDYLSRLKGHSHIIGTDIIEGNIRNCDSFYKIDLSSGGETADLIKKIKPDYVIHFAGTFGTDDQQEIYKVNVLSATALLEAIRQYKSDAVVVMLGSAAEYGLIAAEQLPVTEQMPCSPITSYGLSKFLATQIAGYYYRVHNICVMVVRPFQLLGKGVTSRLAPGAFAEQIRQAIDNGSNVIKVGNLESSRDFLDVRDAVEAIWMLCRKPAAGEIFNLCSGTPIKISRLLAIMLACAGADVKVEVDSKRLRGTSDINEIFGSYKKLQDHCDWKPKISLEVSIHGMTE